jgi:2-polyprenyl-6-hydroxyphenyl methylase / 3-demethylubiquinone-9 3-methyltransferase
MTRHELELGEIVRLGPRAPIPRVLVDFLCARRGRISYGELSRRFDAGQIKDTRISYVGYATKG